MTSDMMRKEIQEAISAGERALSSLQRAQENLNSANNWGIVDIFGGGLFTSMIKHSKMNNAVSYMETAKSDLRYFEKELGDVNTSMNLRMEIGDFLTFADFFFDGLVADYLVQSKIANARAQVSEAIRRVESLLVDLRRQLY